jgi:hypothetical protein
LKFSTKLSIAVHPAGVRYRAPEGKVFIPGFCNSVVVGILTKFNVSQNSANIYQALLNTSDIQRRRHEDIPKWCGDKMSWFVSWRNYCGV